MQNENYCKSGSLCEFNFSHAEFEQVQLNWREIRIDGRMYDIRNIEKDIDSVYIKAHRDVFEEHLIASINRTLHPQHPVDKSKTVILFKLSLLNYILPENNFKIALQNFRFCLFYEFRSHYIDAGLKTLLPPPKLNIVRT